MRRELHSIRPATCAIENVFLQAAGSSRLIVPATVALLFVLSGCSILRAPESGGGSYEYGSEWARPTSSQQPTVSARSARERNQSPETLSRRSLIAETDRWRGTPYAYGGDSRSGIDCSAFVQVLYRNAFDLDLPRSTNEQRTIGERVRRGRLAVGDLVFFDTGPSQNHVGVYLGDDEFAHAASSSGVTISSLSESYWSERFEEGIRPESTKTVVYEPIEPVFAREDAPMVPISVDANNRRGW